MVYILVYLHNSVQTYTMVIWFCEYHFTTTKITNLLEARRILYKICDLDIYKAIQAFESIPIDMYSPKERNMLLQYFETQPWCKLGEEF